MADQALVAVVDYGAGNLRSVARALERAGARVRIVAKPADLNRASKIVLPGVGAFGDGMAGLQARGLVEPLRRAVAAGAPFLGICLGMQLLFPCSEEALGVGGLALLPGSVRAFRNPSLKVPHTGWNQVWRQKPSRLLQGIRDGAYFYFNHSYYCAPEQQDAIAALTDYGVYYASVIEQGNIYAVQFHPEKSQALGLRVLRNFLERA